AGASTVAVKIDQAMVGAELAVDVAARGLPAESLATTIPSWADRGEIDVTMDDAQWTRFTDFAVTVYDTTGQIVANTAQNFAFGRLEFRVPPELRGRKVTVELFPAY